jgi:hypothetical protein
MPKIGPRPPRPPTAHRPGAGGLTPLDLKNSGLPSAVETDDRRGGQGGSGAAPEEKLEDRDLAPEQLASLSVYAAASHLMRRLANRRTSEAREVVLASIGDLLIAHPNRSAPRKILLDMADAGRIVDIYPLEVLIYVLERAPDLVPDMRYDPFIKNKAKLEAATFEVEQPIRIEVPLSIRVRAFALIGGGYPGYCLQPGAPDEYLIEFGDAGSFTIALRGELRNKSLIDRVTLRIIDPEPSAP